ncbi:hypothetical protein [Hymenobacter coccineus]|uniref:Uncharacterized protein n=1 Tax=Hymenobacter coccineus TaxID=1908235 RepID=A0A1G1TJ59_9BACT|nr:hypothetical protein [Hymenobacter coccineus]OGX90906.1 hypothetical protein BEN49_21765 [Hymenobacter coccineus]
MKVLLHPAAGRPFELHYLPAFFWVAQEPAPVWTAASAGSGTGRVQAVGTATEVGGDKFVAWSSTDSLCMGGATTTAADGCIIVVHTAP